MNQIKKLLTALADVPDYEEDDRSCSASEDTVLCAAQQASDLLLGYLEKSNVTKSENALKSLRH